MKIGKDKNRLDFDYPIKGLHESICERDLTNTMPDLLLENNFRKVIRKTKYCISWLVSNLASKYVFFFYSGQHGMG